MIGPAEDDAWSVRGSDASLAKLAQDPAAPAVKREEDWGGSGGNEEDGEDTDADALNRSKGWRIVERVGRQHLSDRMS